jgi:multiple antibiotic resistance protein
MHSTHNFFVSFDWQQMLSSFWALFAVMNILGCVPIVISIRKKTGRIDAHKTTVVVGMIMLAFLFLGQLLLDIFSIDTASFAVAGSIVLFILALEMILNINIFKVEVNSEVASIVPLAFPIVAGVGTLITLLTLKSDYADINILCGTLANLVFVYVILKCSAWIEHQLGSLGINIIHKVMGIVLLSIAVKLFRTHFFVV